MTNRFSDCTSLLKDHKVLEILSEFSPEFVGSIPIGVDLPHSDIDIICELRPSIICRFRLGSEKVEIVAQSLSPKKQIAYQHMIIEEKILKDKGETFRPGRRSIFFFFGIWGKGIDRKTRGSFLPRERS